MKMDNDSNETLTTDAEALRGLNILDKYFLGKGLYLKIPSFQYWWNTSPFDKWQSIVTK